MARKRRNNRSNRRSAYNPATSRTSWILLAGSLLVAGGLLFVQGAVTQRRANVDETTFCDISTLPSIVAILIDSSDPFDPTQTELAKAYLNRVVSEIEVRARVDIYKLDRDDRSLILPVFSKCNPGRPGKRDALTSDYKKRLRQFETAFRAGIESAVDKEIAGAAADNSPIAESIREASARSFARAPASTERKLVIISDMLQHTDALSHYRVYGTVDDVKKTSTWPRLLSPIDGVDIDVVYITRPGARNYQGVGHLSWWESYFLEMGARPGSFETL